MIKPAGKVLCRWLLLGFFLIVTAGCLSGPTTVVNRAGGEGSAEPTMGMRRELIALHCGPYGADAAVHSHLCAADSFIYADSPEGSTASTKTNYYESSDPNVLDPRNPVSGQPVSLSGYLTVSGKTFANVPGILPYESILTAGIAPASNPNITGHAKLVCRDKTPGSSAAVLCFKNPNGTYDVALLSPQGMMVDFQPATFSIDPASGEWRFSVWLNPYQNPVVYYDPSDFTCGVRMDWQPSFENWIPQVTVD